MDTVREEAWPLAAPQQQQQAAPLGPQPQQQNGRIDLRELKAQMEKRLGPDRSRRYFSYLNGYLSQKLSKPDFDKMCLLTLGRENLRLHNRLIRSILYNAYQAQCPPPQPDVGRSMGASAKKVSQAAEAFSSSNGDVRLLQVQGPRSMGAVQDHQLKDRIKNMGPNGRVEAAANHIHAVHGGAAVPENGTLSLLELKRSVCFQQCEPAEPLAKHMRVDQLPPENVLKQRRVMSDAADHAAEMSKSPLRAPLGIPFCSASAGGARKLLPPPISSCYEHGELFSTEVLRRRMEKTAETLGLAGVTMDCSDLLNNGLDMYLKNLIRSSVELKGVHPPDAIGDLFNLRHLGLRDSKVKLLPKSIEKLSNLLTLDLYGSDIQELPSGIVKLKKLRHLFVEKVNEPSGRGFRWSSGVCIPKGLGSLTDLQTLQSLEAQDESIMHLRELRQMRSLRIWNVKEIYCGRLCESLLDMRFLSYLDVNASDEDEVLRLNALPPNLRKLCLRGRLAEGMLDDSCLFQAAEHILYSLHLRWSQLREDPLPSLSRLSNLTALQFIRAYIGEQLVFLTGWFPKLKILHLSDLPNLKRLEIQQGAMASLERLTLANLSSMTEVPLGLEFLMPLQDLAFLEITPDFLTLLRQCSRLDLTRVWHSLRD